MANLPLFSKKDVENKRVLVRVDLNAPIKDNIIIDTTRLEAIAPTIKKLIQYKAKIILLSHRGRPKGKIDSKLSLNILIPALSAIIKHPVSFCSTTIGEAAKEAVNNLKSKDILLLENLRFHAGEEKNNPDFAKALAGLGEVYINDGFAVSHRAHASVVSITKHLPSFAGLLLQKEIKNISSIFSSDAQPAMAIVGGSKISTKIKLLESLIKKVKNLAIGGGIANTFLLAQGYNIGNSLCEKNQIPTALKVLKQAEKEGCKIILPFDIKAARDLTSGSEVHHIPLEELHDSESIFDIGPKTAEVIGEAANRSKTVIWNGPVGLFEHQPFDRGSVQIAQNIAHLTHHGRLRSIVGGGETIAVVKRAKVANCFTYLSTGGGAFLEYLENNTLPGIDALTK